MKYIEVAPLRVVRGTQQSYTYHTPDPVEIGQLVTIPLGSQTHVGLVVAQVKKPAYDTKPLVSTLDIAPLPLPLVRTAIWMSEYYATHLATVLQTLLPRGLTTKRRVKAQNIVGAARDRTHFLLNSHQRSALDSLANIKMGTVILHGVTGSGKTAVYIEYAKTIINAGKSVIVLVPEIALTSQLVAEFNNHFERVLVAHSRQTEAERHRIWQDSLDTSQPTVIIGPRSALFMPVREIGAIIIDEAHEPSYKQDQSPRYSALRVASVLGRFHGAVIVQGSATPLVSEYYLATEQHRGSVLELPERARSDTQAPNVHVVTLTDRAAFTRHRFLSNELLTRMEHSLAEGHQVLLFHNRRGSAVSTLCESCGWMALCPRCGVPYTLHGDLHQLQCHICGFRDRVPTSCPLCHGTDIIHKGVGTKLIEEEVRKLFPKHRIARYDGDSATNESLEKQYQDLYDGKIAIIIGTQVVAKGLDLPLLRTVGVIQADAGLMLPDFSAPERTFQLLAQVVGRVGRSSHPTTIVVQTYQPDAPAVQLGIAQDFAGFYQTAIAERRRTHFPPFTYLLRLTCAYKTEAAAIRNASQLAKSILQLHPDVEVLGPTPAFYERLRDQYRWQLVVKSASRSTLSTIARELPAGSWQFDLDPYSLL